MKNLILILSIFLTHNLVVKSQRYFPFPTENVYWNVYLELSIHENPLDSTLLRYTIHGDTLINQIVYRKLCIESGDIANPKIKTVGGLREHNKKIYFTGYDYLGSYHNKELLLYDFSKQIGDTIYHDNHGNNYSIIENIDSVELDGEYRKRFKVNSRHNYSFKDQEYWIEGIGSIKNGLLGHITDIPTCCYHFWEHVCFKENGRIKYLNPSFSDCFPAKLLSSINDNFEFSKINIYPNPFSNKLHIDNIPDNKNLSIQIIDSMGRLVLKKELRTESNSVQMPVIKGIYIVLIMDDNGQIIKNERIIQN